MVTLGHIIAALTPYQPTGAEPAISKVVHDSRDVVPGALFVALKGEQVDGHAFVQDAFAGGAVAALVERPLPDQHATIYLTGPNLELPDIISTPVCLVVPDVLAALQTAAQAWFQKFSPRVIGITGSVGKTSTKELAHAVLSQRFNTFKSPGNRNSIIGLPLAMFDIRPQHQLAVLEMGMYVPGEIARLCELTPPQVGVVTLIGPVHMERAGSMDTIVAAKQELVEALPANGTAILNKDDERVMRMQSHTKARIFTYGLDPTADLWADNIRSMGLDGMRFILHHGREALNLHVPLLGRHSVHTALRAAAVGLVEGLSWEEIAGGLRQTADQLRLVSVPGPKDSIIIDDTYNASPDSVLAALNLLNDLQGRHVAVLGDMMELGHVEEASHRLVGRRVRDVAQVLVAVGRRSRWTAAEALAMGMSPRDVIQVADAKAAVSALEKIIQPKDIILVKGSLSVGLEQVVNALGRYD